jgi:oxygen-dependent protoporphyrinogen oxidase
MKDDRPVAVLGAGLAGLVAARELSRNGVRVRVFEAGHEVAHRMARDEDGFCCEPLAHFITNRLAAALDIGKLCLAVRRFREGVYLEGRHHRLPMGLLGVPRFLLSALDDRARRRRAHPRNAREWFIQRYGAALADEIAAPLLEAWTGVGAELLSPALCHRLPGAFRRRLFEGVASRVTGRSVAPRRSPNVFHVYPEAGVRAIVERLAAELGDRIELESPISKIAVEGGRIRAIRVAGKDVDVRAVVSTAPINRLAEIVVGSERLQRFKTFRFRPGIFVQLKLEGTHLMPEVVTWVPSGKPFFRLTEAPQSMPWLAPRGKSSLLVEYGAAIGDHLWNLGEAELAEHTLVHLEPLLRDVRRRFIGARVQRSALAYPMLLREYEDERVALAQGTGIDGLVSVGRNGEFDHLVFEDVYWRTTERMRSLLATLG